MCGRDQCSADAIGTWHAPAAAVGPCEEHESASNGDGAKPMVGDPGLARSLDPQAGVGVSLAQPYSSVTG